ncbi:MAG: phosphatidylglycerol lysyltransferase domain-containing protein [bacterium]
MKSDRLDKYSVRFVATIVFLSGLLAVSHVWFVKYKTTNMFFQFIFPEYFYHWRTTTLLLLGLFLVYQSINLYRRSLVSWWTTIIILVIMFTLSLFHHNHRSVTALAVINLIILFIFKKKFVVRSEMHDIKRGSIIALLMFIFATTYGTVGFWLLEREDFGIDFGWVESFRRAISEITFIGNYDLIAQTSEAIWFIDSLKAIGLFSFGLIVYSLYRPLRYRLVTLPHERVLVKKILVENGGGSNGELVLWPEDKSYYFSNTSKSVITYKVAADVAVCLGEPLGSSTEFSELITSFHEYCLQSGWNIVHYNLTKTNREIFQKNRFKFLKIGEEAVVDLEKFNNQSCKSKSFRRVLNKFKEMDIEFVVAEPELDINLVDQLQEVSNEWLKSGRKERTFTVGFFDEHKIKTEKLFYLKDNKTSKIIAFANEMITHEPGLATIDMMRYAQSSPNSAMDYLFTKLFEYYLEMGYKKFSLGLAPLSGFDERPNMSIEEKSMNIIFKTSRRFFSFKGLRDYKNKFDPDWQDRYLAYNGSPITLARIGYSLTRVTKI